MKLLLLLPLLLGFSVPAIAHNDANGGECGIQADYCEAGPVVDITSDSEE